MKTIGWVIGVATLVSAIPSFAKTEVGQRAPAFTMTLYDKTKVSSEDLRGQVVVINYWATWCGPCKAEMPMISAYAARHKKDGLRVFATKTEDSVPDFQLKKLASVLSFPLVTRMKTSGYGVLTGVPTNYVIDRYGIVRYAKAGAFTEDEFETVVEPLLRQPVPAAPPS